MNDDPLKHTPNCELDRDNLVNKNEKPRITAVYNWANGQTMVFDQFGEQMPEFQGPTEEVMPRIWAAGWTAPVKIVEWPGP